MARCEDRGELETTFGGPPIVKLYPHERASAASLAAGPAITALAGGSPPGGLVDAIPGAADAPRPATDDWPFLYLLAPGLPSHYFIALGLILAWAIVMITRAAQRSGTSLRRFSPHFFVLGIAFLLLETRSIVTFSLLFGSTWLVNALVFFAVLASVLLAILVAWRFKIPGPWWLYAALLGSIALAYVLPPASLLIDPPWLRYVAAGALAFAPVFFANLVFSYSFRDTRTADMAFASNLFGAMVGGAIEYVALITGYQALLLVVAGLYVAAYVLAERVRVLADVELATGPEAGPIAEAPAPAVMRRSESSRARAPRIPSRRRGSHGQGPSARLCRPNAMGSLYRHSVASATISGTRCYPRPDDQFRPRPGACLSGRHRRAYLHTPSPA